MDAIIRERKHSAQTGKGLEGEITLLNVKPAMGFTLPSAGMTSFGFAQDRLCTR
jgi:hypothetical protein